MYVQLIEPDGTENIKVTFDAAVEYCAEYPGWTWGYNDDIEQE